MKRSETAIAADASVRGSRSWRTAATSTPKLLVTLNPSARRLPALPDVARAAAKLEATRRCSYPWRKLVPF